MTVLYYAFGDLLEGPLSDLASLGVANLSFKIEPRNSALDARLKDGDSTPN